MYFSFLIYFILITNTTPFEVDVVVKCTKIREIRKFITTQEVSAIQL